MVLDVGGPRKFFKSQYGAVLKRFDRLKVGLYIQYFPVPYSLAYLFISAAAPTHSIIILTMTPYYRKKIVELVKMASSSAVQYNNVCALLVLKKHRQ